MLWFQTSTVQVLRLSQRTVTKTVNITDVIVNIRYDLLQPFRFQVLGLQFTLSFCSAIRRVNLYVFFGELYGDVNQMWEKFIDICYSEAYRLFRSGTDLISLLVMFFLLFFLSGRRCSKNAKKCLRRFKSGWIKFEHSIVLQVGTHQLTKSDFRFDVTLSRWQSCRHFTQKSAAIWWVHMPVPDP